MKEELLKAKHRETGKIYKVLSIFFKLHEVYLAHEEGNFYENLEDVKLLPYIGIRDIHDRLVYAEDMVKVFMDDGFSYGEFIGEVHYVEGEWVIIDTTEGYSQEIPIRPYIKTLEVVTEEATNTEKNIAE